MLEFLAQLADMALDHILVDVLIEETIDRIEDLRFTQAPAAAAQQIFKNALLAARKRKRLAVHLGLAPVEVDAQFADDHVALLAEDAAVDRSYARQNLTHVHGFSHNVIDSGGEQTERVVERVTLVEAKDRRVCALADHSR